MEAGTKKERKKTLLAVLKDEVFQTRESNKLVSTTNSVFSVQCTAVSVGTRIFSMSSIKTDNVHMQFFNVKLQ